MGDRAIEVRRVREGDWRRLREIRLEALDDSPEAYITTLAEARRFPDSLWRDRVASGSRGDEQATMIAVEGARTVGMAIGLQRLHRSSVAPGVVAIVSVYVSPDVRRRGVARRLMAAVEAWAASVGATTTSLWVVEGNDGARAFYESLGYAATLDRQRIEVPPARWETRMVKRLEAGDVPDEG
jgi:GNAT superfamily N-acetyltransferase